MLQSCATQRNAAEITLIGAPSQKDALQRGENARKNSFLNYFLIGDLALISVALGDKAAALALAQKGTAVNPLEKDAIDGPVALEFVARVSAQAGEPDRAVTVIQKLLSIPASAPFASNVPLTPALLRLDPMFDPLRNDPRFQKLASTTPTATDK